MGVAGGKRNEARTNQSAVKKSAIKQVNYLKETRQGRQREKESVRERGREQEKERKQNNKAQY